jgi:3-oxoacyl-[acyl-carrier protein] reductase
VRFDNKVAIVTASAGAGIGQAAVRAFAKEGAHVVVSDLKKERVDKIIEDLAASSSPKALGIACDVTSQQQVEDMVKQVLQEFGTIDILVNNAGIEVPKLITETTNEEWELINNVILRGTFYCTRTVLPTMMKAKKGRIINMSSVSALTHDGPGSVAYSAAKAGIIGFTKALARDVGQYNITVNAIAPGSIPNPYLNRVSPPGFFEALLKKNVVGRLGDPEDIANAILFLASEESSYMTGSTLCISGGSYMY